jgi:hypothetical protein
LITLWLSDVSSTIVTRYSSPPGESRKTIADLQVSTTRVKPVSMYP